jgi:PAS domain S-box-containing protein
MAVQHYTDRKAYGENEQRTLEYVSTQIATVIQRKRTEEALRESEERYRTVAETATDGIITIDQHSRILFANPAVSRIFGYDLAAMPGMDLTMLMPDHLRQLHKNAVQRYAATGEKHMSWERVELSGLHKQGHEIPVEVSFAEFRKNGQPFFTGFIRDVSERKQAEKALRDSEEKFSRAFHASPDAMTISALEDSRFLEVNESFLRLTGYPREEVAGRTSLELNLWVHPENRPGLSSQARVAGKVEDFEFELRRKDGAALVCLLSVDIVEIAGRKCFLSVVRDITARKHMEEALRQSEEKFARAFFASPDALVISSLRTAQFLDVNESFCRMSGYAKEEAVGRTGLDLGVWARPEDREHVLQMLARGESPRNLEFTFRSRTGRTVVGLLSAEIIEFGGERCMLGVVRDITERKEMEEALRTSEERFRELFENANDIVYTHDLEGNFTSLNRTGERITGYPRAEALQKNIRDLLDPQQVGFAQEMVRLNLEGKGPTTYELQIRARDGRPIELEVSTRLILFDGRPVGVQGIARDVTERRKAERALRDSEERYRLLFQNSPLPMFVYETDSLTFLAVNEAAVKSYGFSRSEFLGLTLKDIRPPEEGPYLIRRLTSDPINHHAAVHRKKDGTLIDVEIAAHSIEWFGKRARMVIAEDITERVRAEHAIRESEAKFRTLAESSPYAILIARDTQIVFANRAAEEITGYCMRELLQLDPLCIVSPAHRDMVGEKRAQRRQGSREAQRFEVRFTTKNGTEKWMDVTTNAITYEGQPAILVNAMDVTERKAVEDQLRQSQKMEAVGRLAGGVAHDFNNLLMIMRGYADLILDTEEADDATRRNAEQITKAAERAAGLTQQLLAFSRKQVLAPQVLDLNQVVAGVDKMLRRLIGEDIELITSAAADLWPVKADPNQIEQILLNLSINARDAMPKGGKLMISMENVTLDGFFVRQHAGSSEGPHVLISVTDTGAGMAPDVRARVFEPFFTTKEVGRGTGLGLATVYGIVKQSNGYITVYSEVGQGTTFKVYLPQASGAVAALEQSEARGHQGGSETILLVEDESDVRELARQFLDSHGYRVLEAHDGREALTVSSRHNGPIDLLVTDVVMPGMSGRELAERLIPARPAMKVLYVSGYTAEAIGHHGILEPGTQFLQKPFSREALARKLREVLDKRN